MERAQGRRADADAAAVAVKRVRGRPAPAPLGCDRPRGLLLPLSLAGRPPPPPRRPGTPTPRSPPPRRARWPAAWTPAYLHTCGVRTNGTLACWGNNAIGQATPPAGTFTAVSGRAVVSTPAASGQRHPRLLGRQLKRPGHPARGHLHRGERRRRPHLRGEDERHRSPAGATTTTARPPRPPAPSPRSAPAPTTPAG